MSDDKRPERRFVVDIRITADNWDLVLDELDELPRIVGPESNGAFGAGPRASYSVNIRENPEMTGEKYHALLDAYLAARKERNHGE